MVHTLLELFLKWIHNHHDCRPTPTCLGLKGLVVVVVVVVSDCEKKIEKIH
jgi:hypothetical protein